MNCRFLVIDMYKNTCIVHKTETLSDLMDARETIYTHQTQAELINTVKAFIKGQEDKDNV